MKFGKIRTNRFLMKICKDTGAEEMFFVKGKERNETFTDGFVVGLSLIDISEYVSITAAVIAADSETKHLCDFAFRELTEEEKTAVEQKIDKMLYNTVLESKKLVAQALDKEFKEPAFSITINAYDQKKPKN